MSSQMNKLSLSIDQFAKDDAQLHKAITVQLQEYNHGKRPLHALSYESRCVLEQAETGNDDVIEAREIEIFRMPSWNELGALARVMLPIVMVFFFATTAMAARHSMKGGHRHVTSNSRAHSGIKVAYQGQYSWN